MARISIIIPDNLIKKADKYSKYAGYSRSEFIRHLIRKFFSQLEQKEKSDV